MDVRKTLHQLKKQRQHQRTVQNDAMCRHLVNLLNTRNPDDKDMILRIIIDLVKKVRKEQCDDYDINIDTFIQWYHQIYMPDLLNTEGYNVKESIIFNQATCFDHSKLIPPIDSAGQYITTRRLGLNTALFDSVVYTRKRDGGWKAEPGSVQILLHYRCDNGKKGYARLQLVKPALIVSLEKELALASLFDEQPDLKKVTANWNGRRLVLPSPVCKKIEETFKTRLRSTIIQLEQRKAIRDGQTVTIDSIVITVGHMISNKIYV